MNFSCFKALIELHDSFEAFDEIVRNFDYLFYETNQLGSLFGCRFCFVAGAAPCGRYPIIPLHP